MSLIYCPYTDREVPKHQTNREHIIPLALGGVNGFEIAVDSKFNSTLGSDLDGALANEFLFAVKRTKYDARGHSGKPPVATIKRATYGEEGRRAQVHFHHRKQPDVWDVRDRELKRGVGKVRGKTSLNIDLPVRFAAKVALASGYHVYGRLFRTHVDHRQLRDVMNIDPSDLDLSKDRASLGLQHLTLRVDRYLNEPRDDFFVVLREYCSTIDGSVVMLMPGSECFGAAVGILGQYVGLVNVPANTKTFPNDGDYRSGHVIALVDGDIKRSSLMHCLEQFAKQPADTAST